VPGQSYQVLRGGSFVLDGVYLRNSFRMKQRPDVRTDDIGFRVAHDAPDQGSR
jgi:formylglycine-generating enzyme required for sulfatase activity